MKKTITRIYTGADGESHFGEFEFTLTDDAFGLGSPPVNATGVYYKERFPGKATDWHTATQRQLVIVVKGGMEIETGDGAKRQFKTGEIFLAEDTTGRGHISRTVGNRPRALIIVTLE